MLSDREAVEFFHLLFMRFLSTGPDKASYVVKGGCNLRFFFGSIRYSEDIDLDVRDAPAHAVKTKVDQILGGKPLALALKAAGIQIGRTSAPKQTETTQRWKIALDVAGKTNPLNTKIEFSRRDTDEEASVEPIDAAVIHHYRLMPVLVRHYGVGPALRQKVQALVGRREVQARDVFDLSVLLARAGGDVSALEPVHHQMPAAIDRALEVSYDDFAGQVVSYLLPEQAEELGSRQAWNTLQLLVIEALERAAR